MKKNRPKKPKTASKSKKIAERSKDTESAANEGIN